MSVHYKISNNKVKGRVFFIIDTLNFELSCSKNCHLEVCLPCSRLQNDNSKLKSDDLTLK